MSAINAFTRAILDGALQLFSWFKGNLQREAWACAFCSKSDKHTIQFDVNIFDGSTGSLMMWINGARVAVCGALSVASEVLPGSSTSTLRVVRLGNSLTMLGRSCGGAALSVLDQRLLGSTLSVRSSSSVPVLRSRARVMCASQED